MPDQEIYSTSSRMFIVAVISLGIFSCGPKYDPNVHYSPRNYAANGRGNICVEKFVYKPEKRDSIDGDYQLSRVWKLDLLTDYLVSNLKSAGYDAVRSSNGCGMEAPIVWCEITEKRLHNRISFMPPLGNKWTIESRFRCRLKIDSKEELDKSYYSKRSYSTMYMAPAAVKVTAIARATEQIYDDILDRFVSDLLRIKHDTTR